ncbi:MAG TPA: RNase A-like domain-containing protein [Acetobacteraceae bacterium]|nr:RNase A-like domain-containing protein [Acetobacteraceae bacterium]
MSEASTASPEPGLQIILSPVQLAAILQRATIKPHEEVKERLIGSAILLGGALELAGSAVLLLAPDPTMATKAGGWVLLVHGADTTSTGLRQIWTGEPQSTMTATAVTMLARDFGASTGQARMVGTVVDTVVPLLAAAGIGAARVLSVRAGMIDLAAEEAAGGHTIALHVEQTEAQLADRLATQPRIPAASSFRTLDEAETFISRALEQEFANVQSWARGAPVGARYRIVCDMGETVGYSLSRGASALQNVNRLLIVLQKVEIGDRLYFVLTAYPVR